MQGVNHAGAVLEVDDGARDVGAVVLGAVPDAVVEDHNHACLSLHRHMVVNEIILALRLLHIANRPAGVQDRLQGRATDHFQCPRIITQSVG